VVAAAAAVVAGLSYRLDYETTIMESSYSEKQMEGKAEDLKTGNAHQIAERGHATTDV
jgi:hypothetical protein